ncbi:MAG: tRNA epoxyqueuosine(34) reductase QueG, partial [Flavobacteriales bacterium]|nr:tRNA epoxyqueuosine(34) reductase QueG [Flavobacteriales bacterium]
EEINALVKKLSQQEGFFSCGVSSATYLPETDQHLKHWVSEGKNATMSYMERNADKRADPGLLVPEAKSVISLLMNYFPKEIQDNNTPIFSKYAYGKDYHTVIKDKMHHICVALKKEIGEFSYRAFTDSAPVAEREWARRSGLGVIGKSGMLIVPQHGSYFFISEIIMDVAMSYDSPLPIQDICKGCRRCQMACPTGAIDGSRTIDARKCISFHTIESKEKIPDDIVAKMGNRVYGCDTCMDVCPWNRFAKSSEEDDFSPNEDILHLDKNSWLNMDDKYFEEKFALSAIKRTGLDRIKKNIELKTSF